MDGVIFVLNVYIFSRYVEQWDWNNFVLRMCLAANIPLVESGTAGYLGQVTVIRKVSTLTLLYRYDFKYPVLCLNIWPLVLTLVIFPLV